MHIPAKKNSLMHIPCYSFVASTEPIMFSTPTTVNDVYQDLEFHFTRMTKYPKNRTTSEPVRLLQPVRNISATALQPSSDKTNNSVKPVHITLNTEPGVRA